MAKPRHLQSARMDLQRQAYGRGIPHYLPGVWDQHRRCVTRPPGPAPTGLDAALQVNRAQNRPASALMTRQGIVAA